MSTDERLKSKVLDLYFEINVNKVVINNEEYANYEYSDYDGYEEEWTFPIYGWIICMTVTFFTVLAIIIKVFFSL